MRFNIKITVMFVLLCAVFFTSSCVKHEKIGLWEQKCEACHDGRTELGGKVVVDKDQLKSKYRSLDEFINACDGSPSCMNILKHDKELFMKVGKEIGIPDTQ